MININKFTVPTSKPDMGLTNLSRNIIKKRLSLIKKKIKIIHTISKENRL